MFAIASATLELTNICNLRCSHCFNDSHPYVHRHDMNCEIARLALADLRDHNTRPLDELWLTGGDPLLHARFEEMVELCSSFGHQPVVLTHGRHDQQRLGKLVNCKNHIRRVHLSLEGMRGSNDAVRGEGTFDHIISRTIPFLKQAGIHVCVTIHLRRQNQGEIRELAQLIIDGLDCDLKFGILRPIGRAQHNMEPEMLSPAELYECIKVIYEIKEKYARKRIWHDWEIFTEEVKFYVQDFHGRASCPAGMQSIVAYTSQFDVYPCVQLRFPYFLLGNFKETYNLGALFERPHSKEVYARLNVKSLQCNKCSFFKTSCQGGCPAVAYGLHETPESLSQLDPYCFAHLIPSDEIPVI